VEEDEAGAGAAADLVAAALAAVDSADSAAVAAVEAGLLVIGKRAS
jgi:hypothetical protein